MLTPYTKAVIEPPVLEKEKNKHITDTELLEKFEQTRDNHWLGILLKRYSLMLFGVCMKYMKNEEDAKDCVQQIFLKLINDLPRFQISYFKSWIYTIARNHCLMVLRDRKNIRVEWSEQHQPTYENQEQTNSPEQKEALLTKLEAAISELKPEQQQCINFFYLEKKSYAEIAELTGYSLMQVKSFLQNGKRKLEIMMKENEEPLGDGK